jgi:ABC-type thiamine transport system ATPase subunit/GNAT superfamily N-acetyltransferase
MPRTPTHRTPRPTPAAPNASRDAIAACAAFGIIPAPNHHTPMHINPAILNRAVNARVVLLTGPSGSGKSRLLQALAAATTHPVHHAHPPTGPCVFDALNAPPDRAQAALAAAGLAEPALWLRPPDQLSVGERARLALAAVMARARPGDVVCADEFATPLDRFTAQALAHTAARWARAASITLIAATAHEDMPALVAPDLLIDAATQAPIPPPLPLHPAIRIEPGSLTDYHALAHLHYLADRPAAVVRTLRAVRTDAQGHDHLAGVLTVSMPTLNAPARAQAWPGRYHTRDRRADARRLNDEVRCISRVITDPRSRGLGIATRLVRAYLDNPLTPHTEALAAIGNACPFFRRAGMTEYHLPTPEPDARLADTLAHLNIDPAAIARDPTLTHPLLTRELTRWSRHARIQAPDPQSLSAAAATRLLTTPRAYAHHAPS